MTQTIKNSIIRYLESNPGPQYGGRIERVVAEIHEAKESNCGRRLRELEREGKIISEYVSNPSGRGNKVVTYKLNEHQIGKHGAVCIVGRDKDICVECGKEAEKPMQTFRPDFLKKKLFEEVQGSLL